VARLEKMTDRPLEEFLIAIAGPAVNVVIASILCVVVAAMALVDLRGTINSPSFGTMVVLGLLFSNVVLVLFNMVPAFPMDGGRVLRAGLSALFGPYRGTAIAVAIGRCAAVLMAIAGFWTGAYMLVLIAVFIFFISQQELMVARYRQRQREQAWDFEEPPTVRPVYPVAPAPPLPSSFQLMLRPKISVYTWDHQTGTWRPEPGATN
jgi:Zn-dependent protease